ncbi:MAG: menaquinone biosynthesis decarboxylase [Chloroflexi bacterium]|nr:menaquinone biosynthesis decarboxylase [Chloroflexota bacterium]
MARSYRDLREFVAFLESRGELTRIKAAVSWDLEISQICDRVVKQSGPALLFENVSGYKTPVLINTFGTARRMAWALGVDDLDELGERVRKLLHMVQGPPQGLLNKLRALADLAKMARIAPQRVDDAPCQEVVLKGDEVDLFKLPIIKCWPQDAGRYITLPLVITRDPESGVYNLGMYRMQVFDKSTTGMHWQTHKVGTHHQRLTEEKGMERMEVAVALGGDPATVWTGSAPLPPDVSEYLVAGFLRERPVEVVKGVTVDLEVPAQAEIVLEGYVDVKERRVEGPFGDHTGYYSLAEEYPVFHVTAVTHRRDAIYPTIIVGRPPQEDYWMGKATERLFLPIIQMVVPEVADMNMPAEGVFHNLVVVSIKKEFPGHAQKVAHALWGLGLMMLAKAIVVVDHNVNVHDLSEVAWRVTNNIDARRDVFFAEGPVDDLDHAGSAPRFASKLGIDATRKGRGELGGREWPPDIVMAPEMVALVERRWKEYGL